MLELTEVAVYAVSSGVGGVRAAAEQTLMIAPLPLSTICGRSMCVMTVGATTLTSINSHIQRCGTRVKY